MNEPLEEQMGGMVVCDKVYLRVVSTFCLPFCDEPILPS